jgi:hypothetical protein
MFEVEEKIQASIFKRKLLTTPIATDNFTIGVYSYIGIYVFGIRVCLIHRD